jgi:glutathione S-transferase
VLDKYLEGREWLVGDKCTYADIAFIPWQKNNISVVGDTFDPAKEFPNVQTWMEKMMARPAVAKVLQEQAEETAAYKKPAAH